MNSIKENDYSIVIEESAFPPMDHLTKVEKWYLKNYKKIPKKDILKHMEESPYRRKMCLISGFFSNFLEEQFKNWHALIFIDFQKIIKCRGYIFNAQETLETISRITDGYICYMGVDLFNTMRGNFYQETKGHERIRKER